MSLAPLTAAPQQPAEGGFSRGALEAIASFTGFDRTSGSGASRYHGRTAAPTPT
jgi:hypothetical protein